MRQSRRNSDFPKEALRSNGCGEFRAQDFYCDFARVLLFFSEMDHCHSTVSELTLNGVAVMQADSDRFRCSSHSNRGGRSKISALTAFCFGPARGILRPQYTIPDATSFKRPPRARIVYDVLPLARVGARDHGNHWFSRAQVANLVWDSGRDENKIAGLVIYPLPQSLAELVTHSALEDVQHDLEIDVDVSVRNSSRRNRRDIHR